MGEVASGFGLVKGSSIKVKKSKMVSRVVMRNVSVDSQADSTPPPLN